MPRQHVRVQEVDGDGLRAGVAAIRTELGITDAFPAEVPAAADRAVRAPRLPALDRTDIPLYTIDPAGSLDLDQALHIEPADAGLRVHYAIADVAAFVRPGDPVDVEARRRGETLYAADTRVPLHPPVIAEDAASLLPDATRPALLWTIDLDADGAIVSVALERALVRSRERIDYVEAQRRADADRGSGQAALLRRVGELRAAREAARGGISLPLPDQEIVVDGDRWSLQFRRRLPAEDWNAQISLLAGIAGGRMMLAGGIGLLRTLPPAPADEVTRLRRTARALAIPWPADMPHPEFIRTLDTAVPAHAAMAAACGRLLRGSGYVAFDGAAPEQPAHAGLATVYAHVTAPLRRLGDRYALEICAALSAGEPVPAWVREGMVDVPDILRRSGDLANRYENAVVNLVEAAMLEPHVGEHFAGVVVARDDDRPTRGSVMVDEPAIEARVTGEPELPLGVGVRVRLAEADREQRRVSFELDGASTAD